MANKMFTGVEQEGREEVIAKLCTNKALQAEVSLEQKNFSRAYVGREMTLAEKADGIKRSVALLMG